MEVMPLGYGDERWPLGKCIQRSTWEARQPTGFTQSGNSETEPHLLEVRSEG